MESERRYEELRDQYEVESRNVKDESRRRKRAEARVDELEGQLALRRKEVDEVKEARAKDAQELLANAKERLETLHTEVGHPRGRADDSFPKRFEQNPPPMRRNIKRRSKISSRATHCSNTTPRSWRYC